MTTNNNGDNDNNNNNEYNNNNLAQLLNREASQKTGTRHGATN